MIVQFRNEKVSNHGSIPITIDCNVVAFIVFEEGFHQPIKRTKQRAPMTVRTPAGSDPDLSDGIPSGNRSHSINATPIQRAPSRNARKERSSLNFTPT
ncbi:hypothetical protein TNCV_2210831 [Trichonephila clavipes]|nr:hypothetical protein TNCV_2210831 [Trichonephila clavipes]